MGKADKSWEAIFRATGADRHDFDSDGSFSISASDIKAACQHFKKTGEKEVRILCTQTTREMRPKVFEDLGLFLLPVKNGHYEIIKGEGYMDIPEITGKAETYKTKLNFILESALVGDSEMQHLDFAYATSLIRTFLEDDTLVLTIRGRKYTPEFSFSVGSVRVNTTGVQTEVDAGYEGEDQIVLIEAKNSKTKNTIVRQLYYPYRKWKEETSKDVVTLFFEKRGNEFHIWQFGFMDSNDYNSVRLIRSGKYRIIQGDD
jgi:hypothetical protein